MRLPQGEWIMFWKTTALVVSLAIATPLAAPPDPIARPDVPENIEAPAGFTAFLKGHAIGTQNYICAPAATETGVDWLFLGPQATVFDAAFEQLLTHFPSKNPFKADAVHATWQHSHDSSAAWATRHSGSLDSAYVAPGAIEWLLLDVTGSVVGPTGGHKLAGARFIQRVNTVGGVKPPAAECTPATLNARKLVSYEADYYFYR
jgi:hypothetical protein